VTSTPSTAAIRAFERAWRPGHSGRAGIIRGDEHVTFSPLPGDRHPSAGHPLPEPLAALVLDLIARRRGHAALGDQGASPWLFPGGRPGQPISAYQLAERLRQLGLHPAQSRTTALFGLATELPAAVLARLLGIHIKVAVAWQRASAGDWTTYAADYSRRKPTITEDAEPVTQARG
jgi:hypothetical protein